MENGGVVTTTNEFSNLPEWEARKFTNHEAESVARKHHVLLTGPAYDFFIGHTKGIRASVQCDVWNVARLIRASHDGVASGFLEANVYMSRNFMVLVRHCL